MNEEVIVTVPEASPDTSAELVALMEQQNEYLQTVVAQQQKEIEGITYFCAIFIIYIVSKAVYSFMNRVVFGGL